jgi:hypothetical protein
MAVLMVLEVPGATIEQYEQANEIMGIHGDDDAPDGLIRHAAGYDGNAVIVLDVWDSEEALERFFRGRLGAALARAGIDPEAAPPRILPVHSQLDGKAEEANIAVILEVKDLGSDAYDEMTRTMDAHTVNEHPSVSHTAARLPDGGMLVVDLWESPEAFGKFAEEQIAPAGQKVGLGPIEPRVIPVHNHIRGRTAQRAT